MTNPLTSWREANRISISELARRLKCNRRTVYRYEAGEIRPSDEMRVLIERETGGAVPYEAWRPAPHAPAQEGVGA